MKKLLLLPLLFITALSFGQVPNYVPTDSLVGYWGFNGNANDESGNGNDGTVNGATLTSDRFGNVNSAYEFNDDNIDVGNDSSLTNLSSFTISLWVKIDNNQSHGHGLFGSNYNDRSYLFNISSSSAGDNFQFPVTNSSSTSWDGFAQSTSEISDGIWHHLVGVFTPNQIQIYIDLNNETNLFNVIPNSVRVTNQNIVIGNWENTPNSNNYLEGKLDDIGIWNRALDSCEITDLFDGSLGNCCTSNPITSQPTDQSATIGNNATISFTDSLTGATYQWQMDAGTGYSDLSNAGQFSGADSQTLTISSTSMGNNNTLYRCVVTESASCSDTTDVVTLTVSESGTSINELNSALVKIYPNPSDGIVHLVLNDYSAGKVILTDMLGKEFLNKTFTSKDVQINLKSLKSKGTYFAKVIDLDGNVIAIKKLIYQ